MGFFQDLKQDLSQAVNELLPEDVETTDHVDQMEEGQESTEETMEDFYSNSEAAKKLDVLLGKLDAGEVEEPATEEVVEGEVPAEDGAEDISEGQTGDSKEEDAETVENIEEVAVSIPSEEPIEDAVIEIPDAIKENSDDKEEGFNTMREDKTTDFGVTGAPSDETAVVTAGMTINGDVSSDGSVDINGKIVGNIDILGKLNITGCIEGNSKAAEIYAEGANITGEVKSAGSIKIGQSSVIVGNIIATGAVIAGAVKGDIDVKGPVVLDTSAIVMGNIKSKSVQINNGAVIEGLCSQAYADVNPTSFFEDIKNTGKIK